MEKNILSQLKISATEMSNAEKKIADKILSDPKQFISYSMVELAKIADVSQGSIINFSNKFAGGGFPALKLKIATNLAVFESQPLSVVDREDSVSVALKKTTENLMGALKNTAELNDEGVLQRVAQYILNAKKVEIYGVFRSAVVATDFYYQLIQLGIPSAFVGDVLSCAVSASMLNKGDLVFAISSSGKTKDIIDAVKIARENGARVVCLTTNGNSPLAKISDEVLMAVSSQNSLSENGNEVRLAQLAVTDALCSYVRIRIDENGEKYYKLKDILDLHNVND